MRPEHSAFVRLPAPFDTVTPEPISLFRHFFTDSILNAIVANTNLYAAIKIASKELPGRTWKLLELNELVIWYALTIYIGLHHVAPLAALWNLDKHGPVHTISKHMSVTRYEQIKRYLHVSSPMDKSNHYFDKVEPLLSHVRDLSKKYYTPCSNVSVDEMIVRFSGRSAHTIRMKNKPAPEGFKIFSLCDAGYTYTFFPSSRITSAPVPDVPGLTTTGSMVCHLVEQLPYTQMAFNIYLDNYFSTVKLFQYFRNKRIGACGTARKQAGIPKELQVEKSAKLDWDTRSGAVVDGVLVVFWQDNDPVTFLTTIHAVVGEEWEVERERHRPRETSTNATKVRTVFGSSPRKKLRILKVVDDYNFNMGGVDIADQLRSYYNTQQTAFRNWMPFFFWLLDTVIINTFLLSKKTGSTLTQREFRASLAWGLINSVTQTTKRSTRAEEEEEE